MAGTNDQPIRAFKYNPYEPASDYLQNFPVDLVCEDDRYARCTCGNCLNPYATSDAAYERKSCRGYTVNAFHYNCETQKVALVFVRCYDRYHASEVEEVEMNTWEATSVEDLVAMVPSEIREEICYFDFHVEIAEQRIAGLPRAAKVIQRATRKWLQRRSS